MDITDIENLKFIIPIMGVIGLGSFLYIFGFKSVTPPTFEDLMDSDNKKGKKKKAKYEKKITNVKIKDTSNKKASNGATPKIKKEENQVEAKINKNQKPIVEKPEKLSKKAKDNKHQKHDDEKTSTMVAEGWMTIPARKEKKSAPIITNNAKPSSNKPQKSVPQQSQESTADHNKATPKPPTDIPFKSSRPRHISHTTDEEVYEPNRIPHSEPGKSYYDEQDNGFGGMDDHASVATSTTDSTMANNDWELLNMPPGQSLESKPAVPEIIYKVKPILKLTSDADWVGESESHTLALEGEGPNESSIGMGGLAIKKYYLPTRHCWGGQLVPSSPMMAQNEDKEVDIDDTPWYVNYQAYSLLGDDSETNLVATSTISDSTMGRSPVVKSYLSEVDRKREKRLRDLTARGNLMFELAEDTPRASNIPKISGANYSSSSTAATSNMSTTGEKVPYYQKQDNPLKQATSVHVNVGNDPESGTNINKKKKNKAKGGVGGLANNLPSNLVSVTG
ncbi:unnamed protein product [Gordionus sp. m RMFG-2023]|uniref:uncharacterized protein LOC135931448 isoform X2 n=1 Tax=Gordionus sp. m RMFG-2023 TaxID=3053472 RepID=UPI0030E58EC9